MESLAFALVLCTFLVCLTAYSVAKMFAPAPHHVKVGDAYEIWTQTLADMEFTIKLANATIEHNK